MRVEYGPGQAATVQRDRVSAGCRLAWLPVGRSSARLLLQFHPALFPDSFAKDMQTSGAPGAGQAAEITEALRLIQEVDPRLGEQIETGIRWYASLISPSPEVHRSRTARNLHGVIFLSPGQSRSVVAEAIVHEYCHDVLHTWMERERLINFGNEARFYSPWREDPRPLAGLLHALYVFTAVAEFLREAEASPALTEESAVLRDRRLLLVEQLRLGYAQAPREHFTPAGRQLLTGLKDIIDRHEAELDLPRDRLPDSLVAHLRKWCAAHFHLAVQVRRPIRSGA